MYTVSSMYVLYCMYCVYCVYCMYCTYVCRYVRMYVRMYVCLFFVCMYVPYVQRQMYVVGLFCTCVECALVRKKTVMNYIHSRTLLELF